MNTTSEVETVKDKKNTSVSSLEPSLKGTTQREGGKLRNRLLLTILPITLIPLVIANTIGFQRASDRSEENIYGELGHNVLTSSQATQVFAENSFKVPNLVVSNPLVLQALRETNKDPQVQALTKLPIKELESQHPDKLLKVNPTLNAYLERVVKIGGIAEMFFTDSNGFNVAYSNPTSDFVQNDEKWWQTAEAQDRSIDDPEYDESAKATVFAFSNAIKDPTTGQFLGVVKTAVATNKLNETLITNLAVVLAGSQKVQIIEPISGTVITTISSEGVGDKQLEIIGGESLLKAVRFLQDINQNSKGLDLNNPTLANKLAQETGLKNIEIKRVIKQPGQPLLIHLENETDDRLYFLSAIDGTNWVTVGSIDEAEILAEGLKLLPVFAIEGLILGGIALVAILILASQLSKPLTNLTEKAEQVAQGNLDVQAIPEGTVETKILADSFNNLVGRVKTLIDEQKAATEEQRQQRESLEMAIFQLVEEVEQAAEGDLTVRAGLDSMELSTVADLFNVIIENLKEIAIKVKSSTNQVSTALQDNQQLIELLADESLKEAQEIRNTLGSVELLYTSIQEVSKNANDAAAISDDAYSVVKQSTDVMGKTVDSILNLRNTVGETAKKMKRLGESSQKISQVVSLIDEIALKTNLLAINASVEARRAGEQGQGFTVVAEQVGALAQQSALATKEISQIIAAIQSETQEVAEAMEGGTAQVVDTTRLVETTKEFLTQASEKSQQINLLMQSISKTTVSQAHTSQIVNTLMQEVTDAAEKRAISSREVVKTIQATVAVAQGLESVTEQFKVQ